MSDKTIAEIIEAESADDAAVSAVLGLIANRADTPDRLDAVAVRLVNIASHIRNRENDQR